MLRSDGITGTYPSSYLERVDSNFYASLAPRRTRCLQGLLLLSATDPG